jgi:hypothetical protein
MIEKTSNDVDLYYGDNRPINGLPPQGISKSPQSGAIHPSRYPASGHVYFITCDQTDFPIKIGFTTDLPSRVTALGRGLPYPALALAVIPGNRWIERRLLKHFKSDRLRGEWFRRSPDLMAAIDRANAGEPVLPTLPPSEELVRHLAQIRKQDFSEVTGRAAP